MRKSVPTIPYKRKRNQKTNYRKRLALLKSSKNRLIVRNTNKFITLQIVSYKPTGDLILKQAHSKELVKLGWKFSCKNVPAAYLSGLLIASKMKSEKNKECVVDFGLQTPKSGKNKLYATLKGAIDGGLVIPADISVFPTEDQVLGKDKSEEIQKMIIDIKNKILV